MPRASAANHDLFPAMAADIFTRLFTMFPEPRDLYSNLKYENILPGQDHQQMERVWVATVRWLGDEGYIRYARADAEPDDHWAFRNAVLTTRGLTALQMGPGDSGGEATYAERLSQLTETPMSDAGWSTIAQMMRHILSPF